MSGHRRTGLAVVAALAVFGAATTASATKPLKGGIFAGTLNLRSDIKVTFKVSKSGTQVRSLKLTDLPIFCEGGGAPIPVTFKPMSVSRTGSFTGRATTRFDDGSLQSKLKITGKFVKRRAATGTLTVDWQFKDDPTGCDGKSKFSAKA